MANEAAAVAAVEGPEASVAEEASAVSLADLPEEVNA